MSSLELMALKQGVLFIFIFIFNYSHCSTKVQQSYERLLNVLEDKESLLNPTQTLNKQTFQ